jgi:hypothetical protein
MPTFRRSTGNEVTLSSSNQISLPGFEVSKPEIILSKVVFPQPEGPRSETISPVFTVSSVGSSAFVPSGKVLAVLFSLIVIV